MHLRSRRDNSSKAAGLSSAYAPRAAITRAARRRTRCRAQIEQKLRAYAPDRISAAAIDAVARAVDRLEELGSVRDLMDALRATPRAERVVKRAAGRG
jgi:hypothetical protein